MLPTRIYLELKWWDFKVTRRDAYEQLQNMRRTTTENGFSYKPFDETHAIFVHIPKCAGVSVNKTIFGSLAGGHTTLEEYLNIFEPKFILSYFKFTFVRNPWDRVVSAFFFLKGGGFRERDNIWFNKELSNYPDFDTFVKKWLNKTNIWKWPHFHPQYHYILDKREKVKLDFIGYFENINDDFNYITTRIGINRTLTSSNRSNHISYIDCYNDETKDIVAKVYEEDIKLLGYSFDNSTLQQQIASRNNGKIFTLRS